MKLCLPTLPELHDLGFTRDDFWRLVEAAVDLDLSVMTQEGEGCGPSTMRIISRLPQAPAQPPSSPSDIEPPRGGRPPSARVKTPDVLRLHAEGQSVSTIANILGISPRSIRRILDLSKDSVPLAT